MKIVIFGLLLACFVLTSSASEFEEEVKIENDSTNGGKNDTTSTEHLAKLMSQVKRGQYRGSGITPGKSSKFWSKKCSPCWIAVEKLLKKKSTEPNNGVDDPFGMKKDEIEITPTGERKFSSAHLAIFMSQVKQDEFPGSGIVPDKSAKFWLNKCRPCWFAVKKLMKKKATKPATPAEESDFDDEDDVNDMDDLEEDEIAQDPLYWYFRRGGYYGGYYGLPYGGFYGRGYPGYLLG